MRTLKEMRALKKVRAKRVYTGRFHADNHNEFLAFLEERIREERPNVTFELRVIKGSNCIHYIENGKSTNYFWKLPKFTKVAYGILEFRSQDYRFLADGSEEYSYGPKLTKENITEFGIMIDVGSAKLEYHIEEETGNEL